MTQNEYLYTIDVPDYKMQSEKLLARVITKTLDKMPGIAKSRFLASLRDVGSAGIMLVNSDFRSDLTQAHLSAASELPAELVDLLEDDNIPYLISGSNMLDFLVTKEFNLSQNHVNTVCLKVYNAGVQEVIGGSFVVTKEEEEPEEPFEGIVLDLTEKGV